MECRRDVFQAISDPTRREILALIARKNLSVNAIAQNFGVSRPAVSQHIRILAECGLLDVHKKGRERISIAKLQELGQVTAWVDRLRLFWNNKLDALELHLLHDRRRRRKPKSGKKGTV